MRSCISTVRRAFARTRLSRIVSKSEANSRIIDDPARYAETLVELARRNRLRSPLKVPQRIYQQCAEHHGQQNQQRDERREQPEHALSNLRHRLYDSLFVEAEAQHGAGFAAIQRNGQRIRRVTVRTERKILHIRLRVAAQRASHVESIASELRVSRFVAQYDAVEQIDDFLFARSRQVRFERIGEEARVARTSSTNCSVSLRSTIRITPQNSSGASTSSMLNAPRINRANSVFTRLATALSRKL